MAQTALHDVFRFVVPYLCTGDLLNCAVTSKSLKKLARAPEAWKDRPVTVQCGSTGGDIVPCRAYTWLSVCGSLVVKFKSSTCKRAAYAVQMCRTTQLGLFLDVSFTNARCPTTMERASMYMDTTISDILNLLVSSLQYNCDNVVYTLVATDGPNLHRIVAMIPKTVETLHLCIYACPEKHRSDLYKSNGVFGHWYWDAVMQCNVEPRLKRLTVVATTYECNVKLAVWFLTQHAPTLEVIEVPAAALVAADLRRLTSNPDVPVVGKVVLERVRRIVVQCTASDDPVDLGRVTCTLDADITSVAYKVAGGGARVPFVDADWRCREILANWTDSSIMDEDDVDYVYYDEVDDDADDDHVVDDIDDATTTEDAEGDGDAGDGDGDGDASDDDNNTAGDFGVDDNNVTTPEDEDR